MDDDTGVPAERKVELIVSDIHRVDGGRPALEQAVGEPAGGAAQVGADEARDVELERSQGVFELESAAGNVGVGVH